MGAHDPALLQSHALERKRQLVGAYGPVSKQKRMKNGRARPSFAANSQTLERGRQLVGACGPASEWKRVKVGVRSPALPKPPSFVERRLILGTYILSFKWTSVKMGAHRPPALQTTRPLMGIA